LKDENLRSGRHAHDLKGLRLLKGKLRPRNRISTHAAKQCHKDCLEARIRIKSDALAVIKLREAKQMKDNEFKVNESFDSLEDSG
jgi:hypothetical protein